MNQMSVLCGCSVAVWMVVMLGLSSLTCAIPVSMMLPLNTVTNQGQLNNPEQLAKNLKQVKDGGVAAVMVDVWWGVVEGAQPGQYQWAPYLELAEMVANSSLRLQVVMSFHQCGTNVGDECYIPLPGWVTRVGQAVPDIWYRDEQGGTDQEYLSLGIDSNSTLLAGRSPVQIYRDFMASFATAFAQYLPTVINQVQVGLGPAGEMRYPSYQLQQNKWHYCGVGEFQCYDRFMLADLSAAASQAGHPEWGTSGPDNAGNYNSVPPSSTGFFGGGSDNYGSQYGQFFLNWYSQKLIAHGDAILAEAAAIFGPLNVGLAAKISGIHWWYGDQSHAAELTAGYYNTNQNNAYLDIAQMLKKHGADFDFTCLEMTDSDSGCDSEPQELVKQTRLAANQAGIGFAGENALPLCGSGGCNQNGFNEIIKEATQYGSISRFTYLRMNPDLLNNGNNWNMFTTFVNNLRNV